MITDQWIRKIGLIIYSETEAVDLSAFHTRFEVQNADVESPNNCAIRIYNMTKKTVKQLIDNAEFKSVALNAGYESGNYGIIFQGQIKQFRIGKESNVDSYLDILASDGDIAYNKSFISATMAKGYTSTDVINQAAKSMGLPVDIGTVKADLQHVPSLNPRGKVLFGMSRMFVRNAASTLDSSWSIQNGRIQIVPNKGYMSGEAVELNATTGLVGIPEQTDEGIRMRCLLNSKIRIGGLVYLNNDDINITMQSNPKSANIPYNSRAQLQPLAPLSDRGIYRVFVAEHEGDTRGQQWYTNIVGLAMDTTDNIVKAY